MAKIQRDVAIANVVANSSNQNHSNAYINSAYATLPSKAATDRNYQLPSASVYQISEPDGLRRSMPTGKTRQNVSQYDRFDGIALKRSSVYRKDEFVPVPSKLDHYNINDIVVYRGQMVQMVPLSPNNYTGSGIRPNVNFEKKNSIQVLNQPIYAKNMDRRMLPKSYV